MKSAYTTLAQVVILSLWLGAALCVVAIVAPAAFAALPSRALAGALVGRVLPALFYAGIVAGVAVAMLEWGGNARSPVTVRGSSGFVVAVSCAIAQFVIAPRIEGVRVRIGGAVDSLPPDDALRVAFGRLHGLSVLWLGVAAIAAILALVSSFRASRLPA